MWHHTVIRMYVLVITPVSTNEPVPVIFTLNFLLSLSQMTRWKIIPCSILSEPINTEEQFYKSLVSGLRYTILRFPSVVNDSTNRYNAKQAQLHVIIDMGNTVQK